MADGYGVESLAVTTDLREVGDIDRLLDEPVDTFGVPEILINIDGANIPTPPVETPIEDVDEMLEVNRRGTFLLTQRWARADHVGDRDRFGGAAGERFQVVRVDVIVAHTRACRVAESFGAACTLYR